MPSQIVQQPDGRFARFSTIVDDFTHLNCTDQEMLEVLLQEGLNNGEAWNKIVRAKLNCAHLDHAVASEPLARWNACLETIREVHGEKKVEEILHVLNDQSA